MHVHAAQAMRPTKFSCRVLPQPGNGGPAAHNNCPLIESDAEIGTAGMRKLRLHLQSSPKMPSSLANIRFAIMFL